MSTNYLYKGEVVHRRQVGRSHQFRYPFWMASAEIDHRTNIKLAPMMWLKAADHFDGEPTSIRDACLHKMRTLGADIADDVMIRALVLPRMAGFYFSPISLFFASHESDKQLAAVLVEVNNTPWGERTHYLVDADMRACKKRMHVSPFFDLDMKYEWQLALDKDKALVAINNRDAHGELLFHAHFNGDRRNISAGTLLRTWMQTGVIGIYALTRIYWQALKLFVKRVKFVPHPDSNEVKAHD